MKRTALALTALLIAGAAHADPPYSMSITNVSVVACASRLTAPSQATTYAQSTAFTQGQYVTISNLMYMCTIAGTTGTSNLVHTTGEATNGSATFRHIPTNSDDKIILRNNASIQVTSGDVWITVGAAAAVAGKGEALLGDGDQWTPGGDKITQKEVRVISNSSGATIMVAEQSKD
jgi:hypothetical protein